MTTLRLAAALTPRMLSTAERRQANWLARSRDAMRDWVRRSASRRSLQQLDERMLKDIGLTQADVVAETDKPFWVR